MRNLLPLHCKKSLMLDVKKDKEIWTEVTCALQSCAELLMPPETAAYWILTGVKKLTGIDKSCEQAVGKL